MTLLAFCLLLAALDATSSYLRRQLTFGMAAPALAITYVGSAWAYMATLTSLAGFLANATLALLAVAIPSVVGTQFSRHEPDELSRYYPQLFWRVSTANLAFWASKGLFYADYHHSLRDFLLGTATVLAAFVWTSFEDRWPQD